MPKALSLDLRQRIAAHVDAGHSRQATARHFGVSASCVVNLISHRAEHGTLEPFARGRRKGKGKLSPYREFLINYIDEHPDTTLPDLADILLAHSGVSVTPSGLSRFFIASGYSYKKTLVASEQHRPDVQYKRTQWHKKQKLMRLEPHRLVFIDETSVKTNMTRLYGRSIKGTRLMADTPYGHWKTQTFIAGLRQDGITAPWVLDGAMNREAFDLYIETELAPTLNQGDIVILDNLPVHKSEKAKAALRKRGAWFLFLPPYSPDLNPIEMAFSKLKACLRKSNARTYDELWKTIGKVTSFYSTTECWNYFKAANYTLN